MSHIKACGQELHYQVDTQDSADIRLSARSGFRYRQPSHSVTLFYPMTSHLIPNQMCWQYILEWFTQSSDNGVYSSPSFPLSLLTVLPPPPPPQHIIRICI